MDYLKENFQALRSHPKRAALYAFMSTTPVTFFHNHPLVIDLDDPRAFCLPSLVPGGLSSREADFGMECEFLGGSIFDSKIYLS